MQAPSKRSGTLCITFLLSHSLSRSLFIPPAMLGYVSETSGTRTDSTRDASVIPVFGLHPWLPRKIYLLRLLSLPSPPSVPPLSLSSVLRLELGLWFSVVRSLPLSERVLGLCAMASRTRWVIYLTDARPMPRVMSAQKQCFPLKTREREKQTGGERVGKRKPKRRVTFLA